MPAPRTRPQPVTTTVTTWKNWSETAEVHQDDCRQVVPTLGKFHLVFADPPFNIGQDYDGYEDRMVPYQYRLFTQEWMKVCWAALVENGVMVCHGNDMLVELYLDLARELGMRRIRCIIGLGNV